MWALQLYLLHVCMGQELVLGLIERGIISTSCVSNIKPTKKGRQTEEIVNRFKLFQIGEDGRRNDEKGGVRERSKHH